MIRRVWPYLKNKQIQSTKIIIVKHNNYHSMNIKVEEEEAQQQQVVDNTNNRRRRSFYKKIKKEEVQNDNNDQVKEEEEDKLQKFHKTYKLIEQMRSERVAPVDTMGCTATATVSSSSSSTTESTTTTTATPNTTTTTTTTTTTREYRVHCLLSLVLSSQTKDPVTYAAMNKLKQHIHTNIDTDYNTNSNSVTVLLDDDKTPASLLEKLIYPVSFYKRKAQYIKRICKILHDEYNDDIPNTVDKLMELPGVGPKMAYLCMSGAWNNTVGIGVDTHVHRISNRLGWVHETNNPEATRKELEEFVPRELWDPLNLLLVGFGQTICKPVGPQCGTCKVYAAGLCPYGMEHWPKKMNKQLKKEKKTTPTKTRTSKRLKKEEESDEEDESNDLEIAKYEGEEDTGGRRRSQRRRLVKKEVNYRDQMEDDDEEEEVETEIVIKESPSRSKNTTRRSNGNGNNEAGDDEYIPEQKELPELMVNDVEDLFATVLPTRTRRKITK